MKNKIFLILMAVFLVGVRLCYALQVPSQGSFTGSHGGSTVPANAPGQPILGVVNTNGASVINGPDGTYGNFAVAPNGAFFTSLSIASLPTAQGGTNALLVNAAATPVESSYAAPGSAMGAVIESDSSNASNLRWGISTSAVSILSATVGVLMEPGRDSGFIQAGPGTFVHLLGLAPGSQNVNIQWVQTQ